MNIVITAATIFEIAPLVAMLEENAEKIEDYLYAFHQHQIEILITGVGMPLTTYKLTSYLNKNEVDWAINAGIAGSFSDELKIGDVVNVLSDRFGDLGIEKADGNFESAHGMGLILNDEFPFKNGELVQPAAKELTFLPVAHGLTVNKVTGTTDSVERIKAKYQADIETMEGAAFFMVCLMEKIPFLAIRSISNRVEARNKDNWNLPLAIENLNHTLFEILNSI